jgi:ABC-2 type transport system ATP-binding protein
MTTRIVARSVSKRFGRHLALDDTTLTVMSGETLGLVGTNGAGKTTLLRILVGLVRPTTGEVVRIPPGGPGAIRYFGGEHTLPPNVRGRDWLALWSAPAARSATLRRLGVLSRGTRQRLGLEAVLGADDFSLLLLDEPWEGLDPDASRWLADALVHHRDRGAGILVSSHRIHDLAAVCDRCEFLVRGRLAPQPLVCAPGAPIEERTMELLRGFDRARQ